MGHGFRLVSLIGAIALLVAGYFWNSWVTAGLLASLALMGALYEESATFDRTQDRAEFRWGLVLWHRTQTWPLSEVAEVRLVAFGPASFATLEVGLAGGRVKTIESDRGKAASERLAAWGQDLAAWLGVPLVT